MDALELLAAAKKDGVKIELIDGDLQIEATAEKKHWLEKLRPFKTKLVDVLQGAVTEAPETAARKNRTPTNISKMTDVANAARFARLHGENARYCHAWRKWLVWDGRRWVLDTSGESMRLAKLVARSIYAEAAHPENDPNFAQSLAKWAAASERRDRLNAMLSLAESEKPIPIGVEALDREPWLFNVENGTIDLRNGELRKHHSEDYLTKICPVEYPTEPGVDAVLWGEFLDRIFDSDVELITFLRRLIGMALVGEVQEHVLPIFHGTGANGKSVFVETICGMLGQDYAMKAASSLLMASNGDRHPTEVADLFGKRFVAVVETEDGKRLAESMVKELTGGDTIRARRMREDFWQFTPSHSVFMATNHRPVVRGNDFAMWRRLKLIPFSVTIPAGEQDRQLTHKLQAEYPAILRWCVAGCLAWQQDGLAEPEVVRAATDSYRSDEDQIEQFIADCCLLGSAYRVRSSAIYEGYRKWCESQGERAVSQKKFSLRLEENGREKHRSGGIWFLGITLTEN